MGARISDIEFYLPETVITNQALEKEFADWSAEKIEEKLGIRERHVVKPDETSLDLAIMASEKLLLRHDKKSIDFIILCTQTPDYYLPTSACILQNKLGLPTNAGAIDFNQGCSGFIYGLALAKGLIASATATNILLVTAETYTKFIHPKDRANRTIFGDGAAVTLIQRTERDGILEFVLGTDGSGANNLIIPNGGSRNKYNPSCSEITDTSGNTRTNNHLYMNGPEIFNFTIEAVPKLFTDTLAKNNTKLDDIDYVVFHQANKYMVEYLRKKIKIPPEKFHIDMLKTGNTVSSTIPIALKNCINSKVIGPGKKVLLLGFGVGYSWGGTVVEW